MAVQRQAPIAGLPWLIAPEAPKTALRGPRVGGFTRGWGGVYTLNVVGESHAGIAQRILLRYVLGYEDRKALGVRYGYSSRFIQGIITGEHFRFLTLPVRRRLLANGIGSITMNRSEHRSAEVRAALEKLAARAYDMVLCPDHYTWDQRSEVSTDLYLLSGAWREDEQ